MQKSANHIINRNTILYSLLFWLSLCSFETEITTYPAEILLDRTTIESLPDGTYTIAHELKVEVRTPAAAKAFKTYGVYFDDFSEVLEITASVKGRNDKKAQKIKQKHIYNRDYNDQMSVATDGKIRELNLEMPNAYPAVMEFQSLKRLDEAVALPLKYWIPKRNVPIIIGELFLINSSGNIRFKVIDPDSLIEMSSAEDKTTFRVHNLTYDADQYSKGGILEKGPAICLAPSEAVLDGVSGNFDSWAGIGDWVERLVEVREDIPQEAIQEIQDLVEGIEDPYRKVALIYDYVQQRSHYVSIQLGIGGFQPMSPREVHTSGYGDCKALSNYTRLLLEAIDIPARYCVIGVSEREILFDDFPSLNQANHVILAVPLEGDTLWLECTSQNTPPGYIGDQASGRKALLIDGKHTQLVRTSAASPEENLIQRNSTIFIKENGSAILKQSSQLQGNALSTSIMLQSSEYKRKMEVIRSLFSVTLEDISLVADLPLLTVNPTGNTSIEAYIPTFTKRLGNKLVLTIFSFLKRDQELTELSEEEQLFYYPRSLSSLDTIVYNAPEGYSFQTHKFEKQTTSALGNYSLEIIPSPKSLTVIRKLSIEKSKLQGEDLVEARVFAKEVLRTDRLSFTITLD